MTYSIFLKSISISAKSSQKVLDVLTKFGIEWHISEKGTLWGKTWHTLADGFVSPEQATIIRSTRKSPEQRCELDWLSKNLQSIKQDYSGQWIAINENRIVTSANDLSDLMNQITQLDKPFITFIPADEIIWNFAYGS